jgi:hypothetical protein
MLIAWSVFDIYDVSNIGCVHVVRLLVVIILRELYFVFSGDSLDWARDLTNTGLSRELPSNNNVCSFFFILVLVVTIWTEAGTSWILGYCANR